MRKSDCVQIFFHIVFLIWMCSNLGYTAVVAFQVQQLVKAVRSRTKRTKVAMIRKVSFLQRRDWTGTGAESLARISCFLCMYVYVLYGASVSNQV